MNLLYDSESFVVMHMQTDFPTPPSDGDPSPTGFALGASKRSLDGTERPTLARHGFEIVDKRTGKEIYLDGSWAEMFQQQINAWQLKMPTQEEVEEHLDGYSGLAHQPVVVH